MLDIVFDYNAWIAIIAINMTIIGLTSLAEKRLIIGVEYGTYLTDKFKVFGVVRFYTLLVVFALINCGALIAMCIDCQILRLIFFVLLIVSLFFAIYYLFGFILRPHKTLVREIYMQEVLGLYVNSDKENNFAADNLVGIKGGDRTSKKLSSNVIDYFNDFNSNTIHDFSLLFGPESIVYSKSKKTQRYWKRLGLDGPHDYSVVGSSESDKRINHISWEFFQLFRYSDLQDKWLLEILHLFNDGSYANSFPLLRLYNVARSIGQINRVGATPGLFKYKFLDYFSKYLFEALCTSSANEKHQLDVEKYVYVQLAQYMSRTYEMDHADTFLESVRKVLMRLFDGTEGMMPVDERIKLFQDGMKNISLKDLLFGDAQVAVCDFGNVLVKWEPVKFFTQYFGNEKEAQKFLTDVCDEEWRRKFDSCKSTMECVEKHCDLHPEYQNAIRDYHDRWMEMLDGEVEGASGMLKSLKEKKFNVLGLSNWASDMFVLAKKKYSILQEFDEKNSLISGEVQQAKPEAVFYSLFFTRFGLDPANCFLIDDSISNVHAARRAGMKAIRFVSAKQIAMLLGL